MPRKAIVKSISIKAYSDRVVIKGKGRTKKVDILYRFAIIDYRLAIGINKTIGVA